MTDTARAIEPKTIEVVPGSELARLLDEANGASLVLVKDGVRYHLDREPSDPGATLRNPWATYDPDLALAGMREAAGSWSDVDTEKLKEDIYRWREEGSRPPERP